MKKRILQVRKITADIAVLKEALNESPEVVAAYLFGSAVRGENAVNDLDILVLLHPNADRYGAYIDLVSRLSQVLNIHEDSIDLLFFDVDEADPLVLSRAVNEGIVLKNQDPDFLFNRIDAVSRYLLDNDAMIQRARRLRRERVEAFCEA